MATFNNSGFDPNFGIVDPPTLVVAHDPSKFFPDSPGTLDSSNKNLSRPNNNHDEFHNPYTAEFDKFLAKYKSQQQLSPSPSSPVSSDPPSTPTISPSFSSTKQQNWDNTGRVKSKRKRKSNGNENECPRGEKSRVIADKLKNFVLERIVKNFEKLESLKVGQVSSHPFRDPQVTMDKTGLCGYTIWNEVKYAVYKRHDYETPHPLRAFSVPFIHNLSAVDPRQILMMNEPNPDVTEDEMFDWIVNSTLEDKDEYLNSFSVNLFD